MSSIYKMVEEQHWRDVSLRMLAAVKSVAITNIKFVSFIEMTAEFDPVMQEHFRRIREKKINYHDVGPKIQNELVCLLADEIKNEIVKRVKKAKYFSVVVYCTEDEGFEQQMSLVLRCVDISVIPAKIEEFFVGFLNASGQELFGEIIGILKTLELDIGDIRGHIYDNGRCMKEKQNDVQKRLVEINPRAFYVPWGCHNLNRAICDVAYPKAVSVFGVVSCIYLLFPSTPRLWKVLKDGVKGVTLKPSSQTHWESEIESVTAIRFHAPQFRDALEYVATTTKDAMTKSRADMTLLNIEDFEFLFGMVIWCNILTVVNKVSKILQMENMNIDVAISHLKGLISFFETQRETGYEYAMIDAKVLAAEMEIEPVFRKKLIYRRKNQFDENASNEITESDEENFRVNYFLYIVDQSLSLIKTMVEQFQIYKDTFEFLFDLKKLNTVDDDSLTCSCNKLEGFMKDMSYDIDGNELFTELQVMKEQLPRETKKAIEVLNYIIKMNYCFPNAYIAYRILLNIPITVASTERSFLKSNLIKSYIRSTTMSEERSNGLAMLYFEEDLLENIEKYDLISRLAQNVRRIVLDDDTLV